MHRNKSFFKRTRRGKILHIVEDHYLRDDIGCGTVAGKPITSQDLTQVASESLLRKLLVLDTNVILNQIDLLEYQTPAISCVVILETVAEEVRHNNLSVYRRLKQLLLDDSRLFIFFANEHHCEVRTAPVADESPNDRNDRVIRDSTAWLSSQLGDKTLKAILLTNDVANRKLALGERLEALSIHEFVRSLGDQYADLQDLLSDEQIDDDTRPKAMLYQPHKPMSELNNGIKAGRYFQGVIQAERNWKECYVMVQGVKEKERIAVQIRGQEYVNRAVSGDVVAIELLPMEEWEDKEEKEDEKKTKGKKADVLDDDQVQRTEPVPEPTAPPQTPYHETKVRGRVVGIIRRNWRQCCGSLESAGDRTTASGRTSALFVPVDKKLPKIRIQTRQRGALDGKRIIVAIDSWPDNARFPQGHYLKSLGDAGDKLIETEVILLEHDIPHEAFSGKVLACLPPVDWQITPENSAGRRDLRGLPILSIDPPGCKDIDDALHSRPLPNGNIEVGVHIADVTHFVLAGSAMDLEAASRSTSTYLVGRRLDMLPGLLTETLCSLKGGVDRFAFSVLWEITPTGQIIKAEFFKSIIHSIAALTYDEAQMMIDDPKANDVRASSVKQLNKLSKLFRQRRLEAGALTLASPEVRFVLDTESQNPTDVQMYALKEANSLVEEMMLLANITVGKKILRHYPTLSILRRHAAPSRQQFDGLVNTCKALDIEINVEDSKKLADTLDLANRDGDPYFNKVLRILATRCMTPAEYFCSGQRPQEEWHHYGLAAPIYTHFTSPIRRYADVVVHRLLSAALGVSSLPQALMDRGFQHELAQNMNRRHRAAQFAGRASVGLHTAMYFKAKPSEEDAYVLAVTKDRLNVLVPRYGIEGQVQLTDVHTLEFDANKQKLTSTVTGITVQVLDKVRVFIKAGEGDQSHRSVDLTLRQPMLCPAPEPEETTDGMEVTKASKQQQGNADGASKKRKQSAISTKKPLKASVVGGGQTKKSNKKSKFGA